MTITFDIAGLTALNRASWGEGWRRRVGRAAMFVCLGLIALGVTSCGLIGGPELDRRSLAVNDDGKIIVSMRGLPGSDRTQLVEIDAATGARRVIKLPPEVSWISPAYNPVNQNQIVVEAVCFEDCGNAQVGSHIALINMRNGAHRYLTSGYFGYTNFAFMPDGRRLIYSDGNLTEIRGKHRMLHFYINVMDLSTGESTRLLPTPEIPYYFSSAGRSVYPLPGNRIIFAALHKLVGFDYKKTIGYAPYRNREWHILDLSNKTLKSIEIQDHKIWYFIHGRNFPHDRFYALGRMKDARREIIFEQDEVIYDTDLAGYRQERLRSKNHIWRFQSSPNGDWLVALIAKERVARNGVDLHVYNRNSRAWTKVSIEEKGK